MCGTNTTNAPPMCVCVQNKKNMKFSKNVRFALTRQAKPTTKQAEPKKKQQATSPITLAMCGTNTILHIGVCVCVCAKQEKHQILKKC